jgi:chromate transport protein ChrA
MPEAPAPGRPRTVPTLAQITSVFARHANTTFGGGSATIAVLKEQIVTRRGWIDEAEFELSYALSRLTPGTNLLAFCTATGWTARRWLGAIVALLASSLPCSILAVLMTVFYVELPQRACCGRSSTRRRRRRRSRDQARSLAVDLAQEHHHLVRGAGVFARDPRRAGRATPLPDRRRPQPRGGDHANDARPRGVYVVSVGYMADGLSGAVVGWIAMAAPFLLNDPSRQLFQVTSPNIHVADRCSSASSSQAPSCSCSPRSRSSGKRSMAR